MAQTQTAQSEAGTETFQTETFQRVVGYTRVSTTEQADSGLGLSAQRSAIEAEAQRRGWQVVAWHEDAGLTGKNIARPGLTDALADVEEGRADTLAVAKLDRLSRSIIDFAGIMERSRKHGWSLVILDLGVDTTTPSGEMVANVMAAFAQYERRLIGQRTKDALAVRRAEGVRLGRPHVLNGNVVDKIVSLHDDGAGWTEIARLLTDSGIPTAHGAATWSPGTVRKIVLRRHLRPPAAKL